MAGVSNSFLIKKIEITGTDDYQILDEFETISLSGVLSESYSKRSLSKKTKKSLVHLHNSCLGFFVSEFLRP